MGKKSDISAAKVDQMIVLRKQELLTERDTAARLNVSQSSLHKCIACHAETGNAQPESGQSGQSGQSDQQLQVLKPTTWSIVWQKQLSDPNYLLTIH